MWAPRGLYSSIYFSLHVNYFKKLKRGKTIMCIDDASILNGDNPEELKIATSTNTRHIM
jgi:hypothetical protein